MKKIFIIGAGPAGLMAAECLALKGHDVSIYDQMPSPARKFLIAGRGGLNITHSEPLTQFLTRYGDAETWLAPIIQHFPPQKLIEWVEGLGQETFIGSSGRVFPKSMKAVPLLRAWLKRLESLKVQYHPRYKWLGWEGNALKFLHHNEIITINADITILALGGASWPKLGSDGAWVEILKEKGIIINAIKPSNCGFTAEWTDIFRDKFAGQPLKPVSITHNHNTVQGELVITKTGIEGGAIYALSRNIRDHITQNGSASITLDLRPNVKLEALTLKIQSVMNKHSHKTSLSTMLTKAGFSPLAIHLLRETMPKHVLLNANAHTLAQHFKALPIVLSGINGLARAISSAGGIVESEFDETLMLRKIPNTYAIGEMLDWEAPTGGYLLQACFSMGAWVGELESKT